MMMMMIFVRDKKVMIITRTRFNRFIVNLICRQIQTALPMRFLLNVNYCSVSDSNEIAFLTLPNSCNVI